MKCRLTLDEKLRDLRDEEKAILADVEKATGISTSTLQRMERDGETRVGYQDVALLADYYNVSADYLFGMTDLKKYRNVAIDELGLTDDAIEVLIERKLNNRLVSELISHPDAESLFNAIEVYIDRKIHTQVKTMNAVYKMAEETIKANFDMADNDEYMRVLRESVVDEDEYLRYRITERFSTLMKSLFDMHKNDALLEEQAGILEELNECIKTYLDEKKNQGAERAKLVLFAKQIGLNISKLSDEQIAILMKALRESDAYKRNRRRK